MLGFWVLLPLEEVGIGAACLLLTANLLDGGTQWLGWRTSTNWLRATLGFGASASVLAATLRMLGAVHG